VALIWVLHWLQGVLVPLTVAAGFAQLFQPVLWFLCRAPTSLAHCLMRCCQRLSRSGNSADAEAAALQQRVSIHTSVLAQEGGLLLWTDSGIALRRTHIATLERSEDSLVSLDIGGTASSRNAAASADSSSPADLSRRPRGKAGCGRRTKVCCQGVWDVISVLLCTLLLLGILTGFVWGMVAALENFDYSRYKDSTKVTTMLNWLAQHGIDMRSWDWSKVWDTFKGEFLDTLTQLLGFSESLILTILMFFFCLYALKPGNDDCRRSGGSGSQRMVQQYLLYKTFSSAIIGVAVGLCLQIMQVDLSIVFGLLTFVLNYIPNVGAAVAELVPIPLVLLDPRKTFSQALMIFVVPFALHNLLGCLIEPKLLSHGLDLHPLTVVVALTFWSSVWGVAGAVLSVPITSVLRLWLEEVEHPYARMVCGFINGPQSQRPKARHHRPREAESSSSPAVQAASEAEAASSPRPAEV
ncbi:unnamed protein product, partial [Polarella glacialis]